MSVSLGGTLIYIYVLCKLSGFWQRHLAGTCFFIMSVDEASQQFIKPQLHLRSMATLTSGQNTTGLLQKEAVAQLIRSLHAEAPACCLVVGTAPV